MGRQYKTITEVFDFGPHISKVILHVGRSLKGAKLTENQFRVSVKQHRHVGRRFCLACI